MFALTESPSLKDDSFMLIAPLKAGEFHVIQYEDGVLKEAKLRMELDEVLGEMRIYKVS